MSTLQLDRPPPAPAPRRRRGLSFYLGVALILAGLGVLAYVAWQLFGTNVVAQQKQQQIVKNTERLWGTRGGDAGGSADGGVRATASGVRLKGVQALIRIPAFGKSYVMPIQRGVSEQVLAEGFGHFVGTAAPGEKGNFALAAHRVTHGEPLRNMPELRPGEKIIVTTQQATYTYRLDTNPNQLIVTFRDIWVIDPLPKNPLAGGVEPAQRRGQRLITLTTCSELFHTDNRMIAFGHLVRTQQNA